MSEESQSQSAPENEEMDEADRLDREEELRRQAEKGKSPPPDEKASSDEEDEDDEWDDYDDPDPDEDEAEEAPKDEAKEPAKKPEPKPDAKPEPKTEKAKAPPTEKVAAKASRDETTAAEGKEAEAEKAPAPKLVKVKIDEEEYDLPEPVYEKVKARLDSAERVQKEYRDAAQAIAKDFPTAVMDILTSAFKGDRDKAFAHFIGVVEELHQEKAELDKLDPATRELMDARHEAARAKSELERLKREKQEREEQARELRETEKVLGEVTGHMKALGIPVSKELAFKVLERVEQLQAQGKQFDLRELVRKLHGDDERDSAERDKRAEKRLVDELPDEELLERYPRLVEKVRRADTARLKRERSTAKTPARPAERETAATSNGSGKKRGSFFSFD